MPPQKVLYCIVNVFKVCPAGWKPGGATIKPNVQQSKEYFKNKKWVEMKMRTASSAVRENFSS